MPSIPAGTKFHGVAPDVETENRGSDLANAQRDVYTIEEINAGGGGKTTGIDLSLNIRTNPYASPGDHEGTVLSIGSSERYICGTALRIGVQLTLAL